jgi:hypothetical protein
VLSACAGTLLGWPFVLFVFLPLALDAIVSKGFVKVSRRGRKEGIRRQEERKHVCTLYICVCEGWLSAFFSSLSFSLSF